MRFISVTKIREDRRSTGAASLPAPGGDQFSDTDEPGENTPAPVEAVAADPALLQTEQCMINVENIVSFYPRVSGRPGTRFNFVAGRGWSCTESFDEIVAKLTGDQPQG